MSLVNESKAITQLPINYHPPVKKRTHTHENKTNPDSSSLCSRALLARRLLSSRKRRSRTSSSSGAMTSASPTSAPIAMVSWGIERLTSIASAKEGASFPAGITASKVAPRDAQRFLLVSTDSYRTDQGWFAGRTDGDEPVDPSIGGTAQTLGLRDRTVRKKSSRRPQ